MASHLPPPFRHLPPPRSEEELRQRALSLAGRPLRWVAERVGMPVPADLRRQKGWVGQLLEAALGADGGARAEPDFAHLGIELKTIPVDPTGAPRESTWVCVAPLEASAGTDWEASWVRRKLAHVLWVPVVAAPGTPVGERLVGGPILWRPSAEEEATLRADWEELRELLALGRWADVNARHGEALQLRPKAATSREVAWALDEEGEWVLTNPVGFYLRTRFTREILRRHLVMPR